MTKEQYENLMENIHVMGDKANLEWLLESKAQYEAGKIHSVPIDLPETMVCEEH